MPGSGGDGSRCAEGSGGANHSADIAGVLHADQYENERGRAALAGAGDIFESAGTRSNQGRDALGMIRVRDAFEKTVGGVKDRDRDFRTIEIGSEASVMTRTGFAEKNSADRAGRAESFFDQARAFDADGT